MVSHGTVLGVLHTPLRHPRPDLPRGRGVPLDLEGASSRERNREEFPVVLDNKQGDPIQLTLEFVLEVYEALHRRPPTLELE